MGTEEMSQPSTAQGVAFGVVLAYLKVAFSDRAAYRRGWNGKGQFIKLQVPDENSKMSQPYIYIHTVDDKNVPWLASQTDMLAEDWILV